MKETKTPTELTLELKALVFQMYLAGCTQDAIAAYVGRGKQTINEMLKPLPKRTGGKNGN